MNFATFDLNLLRVLDALLSEGSTVKAAEKLNLSQPAVSGALMRLRDALGDPLFVRHGNRLVATEFATSIARPLRNELDSLQSLLAPAPDFDPARAQGPFRIAATDFFADLLMPELARGLRREAPGIVAQLLDIFPSDYMRSLEDFRADLVLVPDQTVPDWIERQTLFRSPFVVVARKGHPAFGHLENGDVLPLDLFCEASHILMSPEGNLRAMGDAALEKIGRKRRVVMTMPMFSGIFRVISETDLISLLPKQLADRLADQFGVTSYLPPFEIPCPLICGYWHARQTSSHQHRFLRNRIFDILTRLDLQRC